MWNVSGQRGVLCARGGALGLAASAQTRHLHSRCEWQHDGAQAAAGEGGDDADPGRPRA